MKIKNYITGSILFLTMLACVGLGLSQPAVATFDSNTIPTMVVLTANALASQTAVIAALPIPTETMPPLPGTLEKLANESTKFIDIEAGFEATFPVGWLTLRPNSEEFNTTLKKEAVKNEMLRKQMEIDLAEYEPGSDRLYSYPLRPDIKKNFAFGFSELNWDPNDPVLVDENTMGEFVRGLEFSGKIPGLRVDTAQVYENVNKVKLIEVGGQFSISDSKGGVVPFYLTAILFKPANNSTIRMTFTYLKEHKLPISSDVMSVIDSIKLLKQ